MPGIELRQTPEGCLTITVPHIGVFDLETHDVAEFLPGGSFRVLGRTDNVINSDGVKLFPEQIEQKLAAWITGPFYIGKKPDALLGERPVLFIESAAWPQEQVTLLRKYMQTALDKLEIPDEIVFKEKFERTFSGKVVRL